MVAEKINNDTEHLWDLLRQVPDPEIPVINLVELGVVREIEQIGNLIKVTVTPTYTGCPAKKFFNDLITEKLNDNGYENVEIKTVLSPAWSTDWLSEETKAKMMKEGISPPTLDNSVVTCPNCQSTNTKIISKYGSTPCQSLYSCEDCKEPFNYFKCHRV
ncbi:phenylacetate-CoA oxygenase subunit PaaJ [Paracrocinitomix mangrovi]|uniref:1,2-phenylacetyl-CoA epoxidase subunit PaaD n=1 Tax=Paracrocinitomix mangrovi TaxID=2862509 RepID=UPI001C8E7023|nr:1,2-phenylacetyl-CoA epoxidase subunit PaaD [Paracrocinitomix mangrovi]UKN03113.1 phenylacetate-CoA oxygenase subunit PaaJ [Paracrocinitomix mangrovi]